MSVLNVGSDLKHKFDYKWKISDGYPHGDIKKNNLKVFSTFSCGGGSSMGYKLAGYDVVGANDIDPQMREIYTKNHNPELYYLCDIRDLNKKIKNGEVDSRLHDLDILDGSPPCSTFSVAGQREEAWGKKKKFREGQKEQTLDDLFFHFIETARLLHPKVVMAENVSGIIKGNAKGYVVEIKRAFEMIGYKLQIFLLNSAVMGVPQKRERVFFIAHKGSLNYPQLKLGFSEEPIYFKGIDHSDGKRLNPDTKTYERWTKRKPTDSDMEDIIMRENGKHSNFSIKLIKNTDIPFTVVSSGEYIKYDRPEYLSDNELIQIGSFPSDYNFLSTNVKYVIGMSVPPIMMAQVACQVYEQWLKKI